MIDREKTDELIRPFRSDVTQETVEVTVELRVPEPQMAVVLDFGRDDEVLGEYFV